MKLFRYFYESFTITLSQRMMFKLNFIIRTMTLLSFDLILPIVTLIIYAYSAGIPGWEFHEMLLFQGVYLMINAFDRFFFQQVDWSLSNDVKNGKFDRYLLYPVNVLAYISFNNLGVEHLVNFVMGLVVTVYALLRLEIQLHMLNLSLGVAMFLVGALFIISTAMLRFALIIRVVNIGRLGEFFRTVKSYGQYPVTIYNLVLSGVFRFIVPLAVLAHIPSSYFLNRQVEFVPYTMLAVAILFILTHLFWRDTLRHYSSAGG